MLPAATAKSSSRCWGDHLSALAWVATAFLFLLTVLTSLIGLIFKDLRDQVKINGRHLDSVMQVLWQLIWRVNGIEDFLEETTDFHPPRIMEGPPLK